MESYQEQQERLKTEQQGMSKDDIMDDLQAEYKLDLDSLPKQSHNWHSAGIKVWCGGAGHPYHSHFLQGKPMQQS